MRDIYEDDVLLVRVIEGSGNEAVVSFTGVGGGLGGIQTDEFVGTASADRATAVFVTDKTRSWSNHLDFTKVVAILGPLLSGRKSYFLGNSMGGFNAVICSHYIQPDVCIAFAPQYSVSDAIVPSERRWRQYRSQIARYRFERLDPYFHPSTLYYAFFGSDEGERRHSSLFPALSNLHLFQIHGAEHTLAAFLKNKKLLRPLIEVCKAKGDPLEILQPTVQAERLDNSRRSDNSE